MLYDALIFNCAARNVYRYCLYYCDPQAAIGLMCTVVLDLEEGLVKNYEYKMTILLYHLDHNAECTKRPCLITRFASFFFFYF